ncbi:MAG: hypothetical protein WCK65_11780, partial [Rhodospirillaceae bacterium]
MLTILGVPKDKISQMVDGFSKLLDAKPPMAASHQHKDKAGDKAGDKPSDNHATGDKQVTGDAELLEGRTDDRAEAIGEVREVPRNSLFNFSAPPPNTQGLSLAVNESDLFPWAFGERPGQNLIGGSAALVETGSRQTKGAALSSDGFAVAGSEFETDIERSQSVSLNHITAEYAGSFNLRPFRIFVADDVAFKFNETDTTQKASAFVGGKTAAASASSSTSTKSISA